MKNISEELKNIVSELTEEKNLNTSRILDFLNRKDISEELLQDYINYNHSRHESYGRNIVFDGGFFKLMVMSWNPNDFTAVHDHGDVEWGAVKLFGDTAHKEFLYVDNKLIGKNEEVLPKGKIVGVCGDLIHQMGNRTSRPFISLHLYGSGKTSNNISNNSRIFEMTEKRISFTNGAAFLKLPGSVILKHEPGLDVDIHLINYEQKIRLQHFNQAVM